jgi:hypothetical protein
MNYFEESNNYSELDECIKCANPRVLRSINDISSIAQSLYNEAIKQEMTRVFPTPITIKVKNDSGFLFGYGKSINPEDIEGVYFNDKKMTTVIKWKDGTTTKVKTQVDKGDTYNPETGMAMCICKKALGNKGNFNEVFKKWLPKENK